MQRPTGREGLRDRGHRARLCGRRPDLGHVHRNSAGNAEHGEAGWRRRSRLKPATHWARGRTQDRQHLLALVVWLKSYQRLGYFPKVEDVPPAVVRHVRDALGLTGGVELEQVADRTAKRHREFVRARIKVTYDAVRVQQVAE